MQLRDLLDQTPVTPGDVIPLELQQLQREPLGVFALRRGGVAAAGEVLERLGALDPTDQVGGSVVRRMAERLAEEG